MSSSLSSPLNSFLCYLQNATRPSPEARSTPKNAPISAVQAFLLYAAYRVSHRRKSARYLYLPQKNRYNGLELLSLSNPKSSRHHERLPESPERLVVSPL